MLSNLRAVFIVVYCIVLYAVCAEDVAPAPPIEPADAELCKYAPTSDWQVQGRFLVSFDGRTRGPQWVGEHLTPESVREVVARQDAFHADPDVPSEFSPTPEDYLSSGYDRAHGAPSINYRLSREDNWATFSMANMIPQTKELNRGAMRKLEAYLNGVARHTKQVWIITCPLWLPSGHHVVNGSTVWFYRFQAIGKGRVHVPTHVGKSCLIEHTNGRIELRAWILANDTTPSIFEDCEVSVDRFEREAGIDLWKGIDNETFLESKE